MDELRNRIKGKPPQTYLRPDRKWIFGQNNDIYYYQLFDPDRDTFGGITVFQFDPKTFQITHRIGGKAIPPAINKRFFPFHSSIGNVFP